MHKLTKKILHLLVSLASVGAFAIGWIFIAHSPKPAPLVKSQVQNSNSALPTLEPIPSLNDYLKNSAPSVQVFQSPSVSFPRLRTRGS